MKLALTILALMLATFFSACAPAVSLRPLYRDADPQKPIVEPRIEGEWISPDADKAGTDEELWLKWKIQAPNPRGAPYSAYSVQLHTTNQGTIEEGFSYGVRLVAVGDKLFFDAELRSHTQGQTAEDPTDFLGIVPAHVVGRIWVQQDFLRIALLDSAWVKNNSPESFRQQSGDTSIIMGTTEELRDFLVRNADDPKALAYAVYLCRPGTDCATRAAEDALNRTPDEEDVLEASIKVFFARGNYARAVAFRRRQAENDPKNFSRHVDLSEALLFHREFGEARRELDAVEKLVLGNPPKDTDSLANNFESAYAQAAEDIVWSYFLEGEYAEAFNAAKRYKPDKAHYSVNSILLGYYSLCRLRRDTVAQSFLKEEQAKFSGSAEEHMLLLDAQGRVSKGFPYADPKSEALRETVRRVWFFEGLRDVAHGRLDQARLHLGYAASEHSDSVVALAAKIELERLGPEPKK